MEMNKDEALNQLVIVFNAKANIETRIKALIYLSEFIVVSCEHKVQDNFKEESKEIDNPYRLKAEGSI